MAVAGGTMPSAGLRWDPATHTLTVIRGTNMSRDVLLHEVSIICDALIADPLTTINVAVNRFQIGAVIDTMTLHHGLLHVVQR